ncbi:MAG: ATP-binding protein [Hansschlegelia sp.]
MTTKPKGNGLGLAKVRSVVEQHGGEVTCASVEGEGATFTLSIPLRRDA